MVKNTMSQESVTNDKQLSTSKDKGMRFTSLSYTLFILLCAYASCVCVRVCACVVFTCIYVCCICMFNT